MRQRRTLEEESLAFITEGEPGERGNFKQYGIGGLPCIYERMEEENIISCNAMFIESQ